MCVWELSECLSPFSWKSSACISACIFWWHKHTPTLNGANCEHSGRKFDSSLGLSTWSLNLRVMWISCVCPVMDQWTLQGVTLSLTQCLLADSNTSWPSFAVSNNSECTEVNSIKCNKAIWYYHYCWGSGGSTQVWNRLMLNNYVITALVIYALGYNSMYFLWVFFPFIYGTIFLLRTGASFICLSFPCQVKEKLSVFSLRHYQSIFDPLLNIKTNSSMQTRRDQEREMCL